ncbi:MAG: VOC family protein [Pirellulaceae bacterium]|nr:VOC family protein [Pirellulaceae bacterium]
MQRIVPVLPIDQYSDAVDFYVNRLGFTIQMEHRHEPGFPVYMVVQRGEFLIGLSEHSRGNDGSELYLFVDDIDDWYQQCTKNKIELGHPPKAMPWGNTEMLVNDPFGNALRFTQLGTHPGQNTPNAPN